MFTKTSKASSPKRPGRGARIAGLTPREAEVLRALFINRDKLNTPYFRGESQAGWCRPHDIGGTQQSHHSNTLSRLYRMGYVDAKPYLSGESHAKIYRISQLGLDVWSLFDEYQQLLALSPTPKEKTELSKKAPLMKER